jgi:hypothetical protein
MIDGKRSPGVCEEYAAPNLVHSAAKSAARAMRRRVAAGRPQDGRGARLIAFDCFLYGRSQGFPETA